MEQAVCLAMIVRNESAVIRRCLRSVRPYITHWAIVDTGSTDGTQDIIREEMRGLPGALVKRPWTDFATARNQSLELGRRVTLRDLEDDWGTVDDVAGAYDRSYLFVIDADEELVQIDPGAKWGPFSADSYAIRLRFANKDDVWCRRQLFRAALSWHYEDEIHERSVCEEAKTEDGILGFEIVSHNDGARNQAGMERKAKRDVKVLRRMLKRKPNDPRTVYYLAQTLMLAGDVEGAIRTHKRRLELGGFEEELYSSAFHIAALREFRGDHWEDVVAAYLQAFERRPSRAEPLWCAAVLCNDRGRPALAEVYARAACRIPRPADALVVSEAVYKYLAADELAGALTRLGRFPEALKILRRLDEFPELPEEHRARVKANLADVERAVAA